MQILVEAGLVQEVVDVWSRHRGRSLEQQPEALAAISEPLAPAAMSSQIAVKNCHLLAVMPLSSSFTFSLFLFTSPPHLLVHLLLSPCSPYLPPYLFTSFTFMRYGIWKHCQSTSRVQA